MSQTALGEAVGVTFQQIQKYERGHNRVGAGALYKVADALNVPISYFFDGLPALANSDNAASRRAI
jgi:transcriptional regulator with XRE-family HTH domain